MLEARQRTWTRRDGLRAVAAVLVVMAALLGAMFGGPARAAEGLAYDLELSGLKDGSSRKLFDEVSLLQAGRKTPPRTLAELQSAIRRDVETLTEILHANAYYSARVSYQLDRTRQPIGLRLVVVEGPVFRLDAFRVIFTETDNAAALQAAVAELVPKPGTPGRSALIVTSEKAILARLPEIGHPQAQVVTRDIVADHATDLMTVELTIAAGPELTFAPPHFTGATSVDPVFLARLAPWKEGEVYDSRKVDKYRRLLAETNLFAGIETKLGTPTARGEVPLDVTVSEAKHRTYALGADYATADGFGANASWEHWNFLGRGEHLRIEGRGAQIVQTLNAALDVRAFLRSDQKLLLNIEAARQSPDAYESLGINTAAVVERELTPHWVVALGASLEYTQIEDLFGSRGFLLLGGRAGVRRDTTDDLLNPTKGSRLFVTSRPYVGRQSGLLTFVINEVSGSAYWPLDRRARTIVAARFKLGSIFGADFDRIPADKRYYSGGGTSVRGYRYQFAGALDAAGVPIGGRSLIEAGAELRFHVTRTIGLVPFIEAGSVSETTLPDFSRHIYIGAGLGVRYYTDFAPIRLDIGFPLRKRPEDDAFQIYVSLGQSF